MANVSSNLLKRISELRTPFQIVSSNTTGKKDVGKAIDNVFMAEDYAVSDLVFLKDEIAKPATRKQIINRFEVIKEQTKTVLGGLTDKDLPKTFNEFRDIYLKGLFTGMLIGNNKVALALIPEVPAVLDKQTDKSKNENNGIGSDVDKVFTREDEFTQETVAKKDQITKPEYRKGMDNTINLVKEKVKQEIEIEELMPKTVKAMQTLCIEALSDGMFVGIMKTALALVPETVSSVPVVPHPDPVICPKPLGQ